MNLCEHHMIEHVTKHGYGGSAVESDPSECCRCIAQRHARLAQLGARVVEIMTSLDELSAIPRGDVARFVEIQAAARSLGLLGEEAARG